MLQRGLRKTLRCAAEHGVGLSSLRMIGVMVLMIAAFASLHLVFLSPLAASSPQINPPTVAPAAASGRPTKGVGETAPGHAGGAQKQSGGSGEGAKKQAGGSGALSKGGGGGRKNPVVIQVSQGRSGSTLTGTMMLEKHPACGWYIDEMVMVIYRVELAYEFADQTVAAELVLNTTQCDFSNKRLWNQSEVTRWFTKRDRFANPENPKPKEVFDISAMEAKCNALKRSNPPKGVCLKEIRFLEHTDQLVDAARRLDIPLTVLFLMRDPRGSVMSQLWNYPKLRFKKDKDLSKMGTDLVAEHCHTGLSDLSAVLAALEPVQGIQICFEDFLLDAQSAISSIYQQVPLFRDWPMEGDGSVGLIPKQVAEFGASHSGSWNVTQQQGHEGKGGLRVILQDSRGEQEEVHHGKPGKVQHAYRKGHKFDGKEKPKVEGKELAWGKVDHPFSTDISRATKVDSWKTLYLEGKRYGGMRHEWLVNADCKELRRRSACANKWDMLEGTGDHSKPS